MTDTKLTAVAFNCTLKKSPAESSTDRMLRELAAELTRYDTTTEIVRVADYNVMFGVSADEGGGDQWPELRQKILDADIFILGTPIWMGAPGSISKVVCERLDAMISETDANNRMPTFGKVALAAIVGNEDGAHISSAQIYQWLNDVGFTVPAAGVAYWVGEAMGEIDFKDLDKTPDNVKGTQQMAASNAAHLAKFLKTSPYVGYKS